MRPALGRKINEAPQMPISRCACFALLPWGLSPDYNSRVDIRATPRAVTATEVALGGMLIEALMTIDDSAPNFRCCLLC